MADKSGGIDFDRQVFVQPEVPKSRPAPPIAGILFALVAIGAIGFLAYKILPQNLSGFAKAGSANANSDAPTLADVDKRLADIEKRLDRLEANRRAAMSRREGESLDHPGAQSIPIGKTERQTSLRAARSDQPGAGSIHGGADAATLQRLAAVQKGVASLESDQAANSEAWQATTHKMADMAGQVGTQSVEVLRNRDELDAVLAETEMEAIPFELYRGANPQPVGPVSLALKSTNSKHQRYTLCVYIQNSCTELKNRTLHEVVQFVVARNSPPLRVIGTKMSDDEMVGYLEVPRGQNAH
jgi:hypothetical protein